MTIDKIINLYKNIEIDLVNKYSEYDLTINQANLLIYMYNYQLNQISARECAVELKLDKRLMSMALKSLEAKDYIIRHPNSIDKRQKDIELTLKAMDICEDLIAIKLEVNDIFEMKIGSQMIKQINQLDDHLTKEYDEK